MIARDQEGLSSKHDEKGKASGDDGKANSKVQSTSSSTTTTTTSWSRLKDPRIVRVSRAFGGKDRHSKVCTVRGLRDRRVRLSVPTAIQLYDLQDRLGLSQPSKVVDWLLNAAKHEIDELPPLQMPPGNFPQNCHPLMGVYHHGISAPQAAAVLEKDDLKIVSGNINWENPLQSSDRSSYSEDKDHNWSSRRGHHEEEGHEAPFSTTSNSLIFSRPSNSNHSSLSGLLSNSTPFSSFLRWDPSNLSLAHGGGHELAAAEPEEFHHNLNVVPLQVQVQPTSGSGQVFLYPPAAGITQSYFPPQSEFDPAKEINFQMLSSGSQNPMSNTSNSLRDHHHHHAHDDSTSPSVRPFSFSMANKILSTQNDGGSDHRHKDDKFQ